MSLKKYRGGVQMHSIIKRNGDEVIFFTDFDYSKEEVVERILKQASNGDCGSFLQNSAGWAMDMWTMGNTTGFMWALKIASDIQAHLKARITLRATYMFFKESEDVHITEVLVKENIVLRLTWDKQREWVWIKRLYPVRHRDRSYDSLSFGAIWPDGIYRQLSRNSLSEQETNALKAFNMKPKQQFIDKRSWIRYDELYDAVDSEEEGRLSFPSQEEADRYSRQRRIRELTANEDVNSPYAHSQYEDDRE